jgi:hypothetical protein
MIRIARVSNSASALSAARSQRSDFADQLLGHGLDWVAAVPSGVPCRRAILGARQAITLRAIEHRERVTAPPSLR